MFYNRPDIPYGKGGFDGSGGGGPVGRGLGGGGGHDKRAGGLWGCPFWVPPAGSPVQLIHLAPVLHPPLIEARRSGAERISGGLHDSRLECHAGTSDIDALDASSISGWGTAEDAPLAARRRAI